MEPTFVSEKQYKLHFPPQSNQDCDSSILCSDLHGGKLLCSLVTRRPHSYTTNTFLVHFHVHPLLSKSILLSLALMEMCSLTKHITWHVKWRFVRLSKALMCFEAKQCSLFDRWRPFQPALTSESLYLD